MKNYKKPHQPKTFNPRPQGGLLGRPVSRQMRESLVAGNVILNWMAAPYKRVAKLLVQGTQDDAFIVLDGAVPPPRDFKEPEWGSFQIKGRPSQHNTLAVMTILTTPAGTFWDLAPMDAITLAEHSGTVKSVHHDRKTSKLVFKIGRHIQEVSTKGKLHIASFPEPGDEVVEGQILAGPERAPRMFKPRIKAIPNLIQKKLTTMTGMSWNSDTFELDKMYRDLPHGEFHRMTASRNEIVMARYDDLMRIYAGRTEEREVEKVALQPNDCRFIDLVTDGQIDMAADAEGQDEYTGPSPFEVRAFSKLPAPRYAASYQAVANKVAAEVERRDRRAKDLPGHVRNNRVLVS